MDSFATHASRKLMEGTSKNHFMPCGPVDGDSDADNAAVGSRGCRGIERNFGTGVAFFDPRSTNRFAIAVLNGEVHDS